jgi:NhaP-type Na+/H+ or K+/H+ antiporter
MMLFFFTMGAIIEKYKPRFGHETCATIILGILVSIIAWTIKPVPNSEVFSFKSGFFFNFFLPPIVFNSGFNMRKKKFFANLGNVALFGLVCTLVCFVIYSVAVVVVIKYFGLTMVNYYNQN